MRTGAIMVLKIVVLLCLLCSDYEAMAVKPYRIRMLSFLPFTGSEPQDYRQCQRTMNMVVELVNNRSDILPDYHLNLDWYDEGSASLKVYATSIAYFRNWLESPPKPNDYVSPITMGGVYTTGCKAWGSVAHHMQTVSIPGSCLAPSQTANRRLYPNFYRIRSAAATSVTARIHFMKKIADWKRIAIFFNLNTNSYNFEVGSFIYKIATQSGFDTVLFEATPDYGAELMERIKALDVRIFVMESAEFPQPIQFLCNAYLAGIRGAKYLFLFSINTFSDPQNLAASAYPQGCNREIYSKQLERTFFVGGPYPVLVPFNGTSALGHSLADFEKLFDAYMNGERRLDYILRHWCYDFALAGIMALDATERTLKSQRMSLRDYHQQPREVMAAANYSTARVSYNNLRHGHFRYSKRLEWDYEPQIVATWSAAKGLHAKYKITLQENAEPSRYDSYTMELVDPIMIPLPQDSGKREPVTIEVSIETFWLIVGLCSVSFLWQCYLVGKRLRPQLKVTPKDVTVAISFLITHAASISLGLPSRFMSNFTCILNVVFIVVGLSLFEAALVLMLWAAYGEIKKGADRAATKATTAKNALKSVVAKVDKPESVAAITYFAIASRSACFCFINVVVVMAWLIVEPISAVNSPMLNHNWYDEAADTYYEYFGVVCRSKASSDFLTTLIVINVAILIVGIFLSLKLQSYKTQLAKYPETMRQTLAIGVSATVTLATLAICFILSENHAAVQLTIAFGLIIYGTFNATLLYFKIPLPSNQVANNGTQLYSVQIQALTGSSAQNRSAIVDESYGRNSVVN